MGGFNQLLIKKYSEKNRIYSELHRSFSYHYFLSNALRELFIDHLHCVKYYKESRDYFN